MQHPTLVAFPIWKRYFEFPATEFAGLAPLENVFRLASTCSIASETIVEISCIDCSPHRQCDKL